ncbi:MAG: pyridoxal-phosphate dependent enzyme, partial [Anaerolineae bacterium]|nr:pyridoxal-phosphate dependent enzyme [Anaerolineae bacterium]
MLTRTLPRRHFAHLPTPIEYLRRLSAELDVDLYVKRDDETGLATGGNKTRKLEFLVAEALNAGCDTLITGGAIQSNHCRQTAAAAAKHGLRCVLVLSGQAPGAPGDYDGNTLLCVLLGAEIRWTDRAGRDAAMQAALDAERAAGRTPYLIPYGGSNATGAAGYVAAVEELADQLTRNPDLPDRFDTLVFASSSGGTHAGLALGAAALGLPTRVLGVSIDERAGALKAKVAKLANETADKLELEGKLT